MMELEAASRRARFVIVVGGGEGPLVDEYGVPFPPSPQKGLLAAVIFGDDLRQSYSVRVRRVSGISFEVAVDGKRHLLPLNQWRGFLECQADEGRLRVVEMGEVRPRRWPRLVSGR